MEPQNFTFQTYMDDYDQIHHSKNFTTTKNMLELNLIFSQIISKELTKEFTVNNLNDDSKPYYNLSFYVTLNFQKNHDKIRFDHFSFELNVSEQLDYSNQIIERTSTLSKSFVKHFSEFVAENYLTYLQPILKEKILIYFNEKFKLNKNDCITIRNGIHLLKEIFPNIKNIVPIYTKQARFNTHKDTGIVEAIELYQKYNTLINTIQLNERLNSITKITNSIKNYKI